jgi:predicted amidohydrolase
MTVKLCIIQMAGAWENPQGSFIRAAAYVRDAAAEGASLICFPEQFATGWDPASHAHVQGLKGEIVTVLQSLARDHHIGILGSLRESGSPLPYNTAFVVDREGDVIARYAKCHLFTPGGEERYYSPGEGLSVFQVGDMNFGIAICYDLRFSPLFRAYVRKGADAVIIPAAWPATRLRHWELLIRARALEFGLFIIGVNTIGTTPVDRYQGGSLIAGPDGEILSRGGTGEERICTTLDRKLVEEARKTPPFVERDRRDALYHALLKGSPGDREREA